MGKFWPGTTVMYTGTVHVALAATEHQWFGGDRTVTVYLPSRSFTWPGSHTLSALAGSPNMILTSVRGTTPPTSTDNV